MPAMNEMMVQCGYELYFKFLFELKFKKEDIDKEEGGAEYRRKSIHARPYASPTIELTQKEVEGLIIKKTR